MSTFLTHDVDEWIDWVRKSPRILSIDTETRGLELNHEITTIQVGCPDGVVYILDVRHRWYDNTGTLQKRIEYHQAKKLEWNKQVVSIVGMKIREALEDKVLLWHNAVFDLNHFHTMFGIPLYTPETLYTTINGKKVLRIYDSMSMERMLNNGYFNFSASLKGVVNKYCKIDLPKDTVLELVTWQREWLPHQLEYMANDVRYLHKVRQAQLHQIKFWEMDYIANEIELPLLPVLSEMCVVGFHLDRKEWQGLLDNAFDAKYEAYEKCKWYVIHALGWYEQSCMFDRVIDPRIEKALSSNPMLKKIFKKLIGFEPKKTDKNVLTMLEEPFASLLLDYREHEKFEDSFGLTLLRKLDAFDMLHPETDPQKRTGRMGMKNPNLQNQPNAAEIRAAYTSPTGKLSYCFPMRKEEDERFRKSVFRMIVCDYGQMELRIVADQSNCQAMIKLYLEEGDVHRFMAALSYHIKEEEVTKDQRSKGKTTNFSVVYDISAASLALRLSVMLSESATKKNGYHTVVIVPESEAEQLMNGMKRAFPEIFTWLEDVRDRAVRDGYVRTPLGRIRFFDIPPKHDPDYWWMIGSIRRQAGNMPIQGGNADAIKIAMIRLWGELKKYGAYIVNVVHDELIVYAPMFYENEAARDVQRAMEESAQIFMTRVPVVAEPAISDVWAK